VALTSDEPCHSVRYVNSKKIIKYSQIMIAFGKATEMLFGENLKLTFYLKIIFYIFGLYFYVNIKNIFLKIYYLDIFKKYIF